jgi:hypothetical protein
MARNVLKDIPCCSINERGFVVLMFTQFVNCDRIMEVLKNETKLKGEHMINIAIYNHDEDYVRQIKNTFLKSNLNKNIVFHKYNSKEDLIKAIKREQAPYIVCSKLGFANEYILCHSGQDSYKIAPKEIMYIAIAKRGVDVFINEKLQQRLNIKKVHCNRRICELYKILEHYNFAYAHNSYIVNMEYIRVRKRQEIQLLDGKILSVSRSKTKELKEKMESYYRN